MEGEEHASMQNVAQILSGGITIILNKLVVIAKEGNNSMKKNHTKRFRKLRESRGNPIEAGQKLSDFLWLKNKLPGVSFDLSLFSVFSCFFSRIF